MKIEDISNHKPSQLLQDYSLNLIVALQDLDQNTLNNIISLELDCDSLPSFEEGWNSRLETKSLITYLHENNNDKPAVYWIEIISDHDAKAIYDPYPNLTTVLKRKIPAYKKTFKMWESKVLYVGKVKDNMAGRMILHLGYKNVASMQGLQLCHWTHLKGLKLRLNIIYLPSTLGVLAGVFEFKMAQELHPILGKHR